MECIIYYGFIIELVNQIFNPFISIKVKRINFKI